MKTIISFIVFFTISMCAISQNYYSKPYVQNEQKKNEAYYYQQNAVTSYFSSDAINHRAEVKEVKYVNQIDFNQQLYDIDCTSISKNQLLQIVFNAQDDRQYQTGTENQQFDNLNQNVSAKTREQNYYSKSENNKVGVKFINSGMYKQSMVSLE